VVEESFRGAGTPGGEMTVYTGSGGGDCGYPFLSGESYLVYAEPLKQDGLLHTGICSATAPAAAEAGAVRELRALRDHKPLDDLFGTFLLAPKGLRLEDRVNAKPLAGVSVQLTGLSGASYSSQTDSQGVYTFSGLIGGTYQVRAEGQIGLTLLSGPVSLDLGLEALGCRLNTLARPDGQIQGTVVDAAGRPVEGFVSIQPSDPAEAADAVRRGGMPGYNTRADGRFLLPTLPPGRYRLTFRYKTARGIDFSVTYFWPSGGDESIDVGLGQHITGVRFSVPEK
jgi:hypothetical protein